MRPPEVTVDQIIQAGCILQESGRRITGFSLRKQIGAGNPARLMKVWYESSVTICAGVVKDKAISGAPQEGPSSGNQEAQHLFERNDDPALSEQLLATLKLLAEVKISEEALTVKLHHLQVVADAVTDELNRTKLRCAELEGRERLHQERISELHSRIDEQRGELHRGSQARIALQNALKAIIKHEKTD